MIKRLIIAGVCLVASFVLCLYSLNYVKENTEEIIAMFETAVEQRDNGGEWEKTLYATLEIWEKKHSLFGIFLKHTDADEIDRFFLRLEAELKRGSADDIFDVVNQLRSSLLVVMAGEQIKAENIF